MRWPTRCSSSALRASASASANPAIFPPPSRPSPSGSRKGALAGHRHLQLRRQCRRHPRPLIVPWVAVHYGWHAAFLITGFFSATWILVWFFKYRKPAEHPTLSAAELRSHQPGPARSAGPSTPWLKLLGLPPDLGLCHRQVPHRSHLVVLSLLAASYFSPEFHLDLSHLWSAADHRLQRLDRRQHRRRLAARAVSPHGTLAAPGAPGRHALLRLPCGSHSSPSTILHSEWVAIGLLSLAAAAHQGWSANLFTTASDMFPRSAVGSVTGIGGMAGAVGGALLAATGRRTFCK